MQKVRSHLSNRESRILPVVALFQPHLEQNDAVDGDEKDKDDEDDARP